MKELVMTFDRSAGGLLTVRLPHPTERISEAFIRSWMSEVMTSKLFEQDTGNELYLNHTFPHFNPDLTDEELQTLGREYAELFYGCRGPVGRLLSYDLDGGAEERY